MTLPLDLPAMPEARIESFQYDSVRSMKLHTYDESDMRDYARAAVLADREIREMQIQDSSHLAAPGTSRLQEDAPLPYRCIKPQCPVDCSMCNHAVPGDDEARILVADLLNAFAVDGFDAPCEDGDSVLVDRARRFLRSRTQPSEPQL